MTEKILVKLKKNTYPIFIGEEILSECGNIIKNFGDYSKVIIISDKNVSKVYAKELKSSIFKYFKNIESITLPSGEKTKSFFYLKFVVDTILNFKVDRNCLLIALGGGVIGDLVGFVSSILLRGVSYIQIPTTLLAQVDSSVGGKTAINSNFGKNLIGTFKQPKCVIASLHTLKTLNKREIHAGYSEIIKYALIQDKKFFYWLQAYGSSILSLNHQTCLQSIKKSCLIKSQIVEKDEKEQGLRALLNFGHTFGHAIEKINNYSKKINHGEAVLLGMVMASKLSLEKKFLKKDELLLIIEHFKKLNLKLNVIDFGLKLTAEKFLPLLKFDKKVKKNKINFILLKGIGNGIICNSVNDKMLYKFLKTKAF